MRRISVIMLCVLWGLLLAACGIPGNGDTTTAGGTPAQRWQAEEDSVVTETLRDRSISYGLGTSIDTYGIIWT